MHISHILLIVIIILLVIIYINYYNKYKLDYLILQTNLDKIDLNLIYEKYPIVIYDKIINPKDLLKTLFVYTYIFKNIIIIKKGIIINIFFFIIII